ncbi:hypothetical protein B0H14DRAFT_3440698 [Mycena olivaceomarginata]|nr:hypothetical protein B0H14DRAFT_3440698 [Mycena olivaceomarginata]
MYPSSYGTTWRASANPTSRFADGDVGMELETPANPTFPHSLPSRSRSHSQSSAPPTPSLTPHPSPLSLRMRMRPHRVTYLSHNGAPCSPSYFVRAYGVAAASPRAARDEQCAPEAHLCEALVESFARLPMGAQTDINSAFDTSHIAYTSPGLRGKPPPHHRRTAHDVLPVHIRLNRSAFNAGARLVTLPPSNPIHHILNGAAESLNGTIAEQMRALLLASGLPKSF